MPKGLNNNQTRYTSLRFQRLWWAWPGKPQRALIRAAATPFCKLASIVARHCRRKLPAVTTWPRRRACRTASAAMNCKSSSPAVPARALSLTISELSEVIFLPYRTRLRTRHCFDCLKSEKDCVVSLQTQLTCVHINEGVSSTQQTRQRKQEATTNTRKNYS